MQGIGVARRYAAFALVPVTRAFFLRTATHLTAGTAVLVWACDAVKDKGISDGYSLIFGLNLVSGEAPKLGVPKPWSSPNFISGNAVKEAGRLFGRHPASPA